MSHETLLAISKKKIKPYNLAIKVNASVSRIINLATVGLPAITYGFSENSISIVPTGTVAAPIITVPAGTQKIYFKIPTPNIQLNSSIQFKDTTFITDVDYWEGLTVSQLILTNQRALIKVPTKLWSACRSLMRMFRGCNTFNQALSWDTAQVTDMSEMLFGAAAFNQPLDFHTSNVTLMNALFYGCTAFNQPVNFDTKNVSSCSQMFQFCSNFNQPINFDTGKVTSMLSMFNSCSAFNSAINFTDVSKVTNLNAMFNGCGNFNQDLSSIIFKSSASRTNYDNGCTAWLTANKPKFTA